MKIGEVARHTGLPAKTIRYYEEIGLVTPLRRDNDYRDYGDNDLHELRFVASARALGFGIEECRHLLDLYRDKARASADVRSAAMTHIREIRRKISELRKMEQTLNSLVDACHGNQRPECPIIDGLLHPGQADQASISRDTN